MAGGWLNYPLYVLSNHGDDDMTMMVLGPAMIAYTVVAPLLFLAGAALRKP